MVFPSETFTTQLQILQLYYRRVLPQSPVNCRSEVQCFPNASKISSEFVKNPTAKSLGRFSEITFRLPEADVFQLSPRQKLFALPSGS